MKVNIPDQLKADVPQTKWGKILSATPVVMAVVATMLAGLSSSEMTRAQYDRSLAAQQQSKAGDQWSFFQAKRLRGAFQRNSLDLLQGTVEVRPLDAAALKASAEQLPARLDGAEAQVKESLQRTVGANAGGTKTAESPKEALEQYLEGSAQRQSEAAKVKTEMLAVLDSSAGQQALSFLQRGEIPRSGAASAPDPRVKAALDAVESLAPEPETTSLLARVTDKILEEAFHAARDQAQNFDTATKPVNQTIDLMDNLLSQEIACLQARPAAAASEGSVAAAGASLSRDFTAARLRYAALRYEVEARLNQAIANLYELQVRKSNISAERHQNRSQRFFYGMLGAQLGVIIATFAIAARQRNLLWSLAAGAGLLAIGFATYVYLCV
jgi:Domain of unknown function (DUF4337)